jgi:hypothetical protein
LEKLIIDSGGELKGNTYTETSKGNSGLREDAVLMEKIEPSTRVVTLEPGIQVIPWDYGQKDYWQDWQGSNHRTRMNVCGQLHC